MKWLRLPISVHFKYPYNRYHGVFFLRHSVEYSRVAEWQFPLPHLYISCRSHLPWVLTMQSPVRTLITTLSVHFWSLNTFSVSQLWPDYLLRPARIKSHPFGLYGIMIRTSIHYLFKIVAATYILSWSSLLWYTKL